MLRYLLFVILLLPRSALSASGDVHTLGDIRFAEWEPAAAHAPLPLVIFSHGYRGCSTQSSALMRKVADEGYLIVAPNHRDASCDRQSGGAQPPPRFREAESWSEETYQDRRDDIHRLIDLLKGDKSWSAKIDWERIGLVGHSLGGYTVLGLAGGWDSWRMKNVKAVVALSPYCAPFVTQRRIAEIDSPIMYQGGTRDFGVTPSVKRRGGAFEQSRAPAVFVELDGAGHFAWTDFNRQFNESIERYMSEFFAVHLRGRAAPPDLRRRRDVAQVLMKE